MNGLAGQIGQRDFSRGDQPVIIRGAEQVFGEFRQLAGSEHRLIAHHVGRTDLFIAVLGGVQIQHELRQRALQTSQPATQGDKARARNLGRFLEVHLTEAFTQINMIARRERHRPRLAPAALFDIVGLVSPLRHIRMRQVRQRCEVLVQNLVEVTRLLTGLLEHSLQAVDFAAQAVELGLVAAGLGLADLFGQRIALGLGILLLAQRFAAGGIKLDQGRGLGRQSTHGEASVECVGIVADELDVMHGSDPVAMK